jgi:hypothetical protein
MNTRKEQTISERTGLPKQGHQGEGGGRPRFEIDYEAVKKLAALQCTQVEVASFLGCHVNTLLKDEKFMEIYKSGIDNGKMSLRRHQWKALEDGNTTMLVWLGKQYLGQREKNELSGPDGGPLEFSKIERVIVDAKNTQD